MALVIATHAWKWLQVYPVLVDMKQKDPMSEGQKILGRLEWPSSVSQEFVGLFVLLGAILYATGLWEYQIPLMVLWFTGIFHTLSRIYRVIVGNHILSRLLSTLLFLTFLYICNVAYYIIEPVTKLQQIILHGSISIFNALRLEHILTSELLHYRFNVFQIIIECIVIEFSPLNLLAIRNGTEALTEETFARLLSTAILLFLMLFRFESQKEAERTHTLVIQNVEDEKVAFVGSLRNFAVTNSLLAAIQFLCYLPKLIMFRVHAVCFYLLSACVILVLRPGGSLQFWLEAAVVLLCLLLPIIVMKMAQFFFRGIFRSSKLVTIFSAIYGIFGGCCCVIALEYIKEFSAVLLYMETVLSGFGLELVNVLLVVTRTLLLISLGGFPIGLCTLGLLFGWGQGWSRFIGPVVLLVCSMAAIDVAYPTILWYAIRLSTFIVDHPPVIDQWFTVVYYFTVSPLLYYSMYDEWWIQFPHFNV